MQMRTIEIGVGAFVLAGVLALIFLAFRVSGVTNTEETYRVVARFDDVAGLRVRAKVSISGVTVGRIVGISVDPTYGVALVTLELRKSVGGLPTDTGAQILTEGILGARYISLLPGADDEMLQEGGEIEDTQSALVLENLVGDLITRMGAK